MQNICFSSNISFLLVPNAIASALAPKVIIRQGDQPTALKPLVDDRLMEVFRDAHACGVYELNRIDPDENEIANGLSDVLDELASFIGLIDLLSEALL